MSLGFLDKKRMRQAIVDGNVSVVKEMLDRGVSFDLELDAHNTALSLAIQKRKEDIAYLLIERGADLKRRLWQDATYLHHAAERGLLKTVMQLVKKDPSVLDMQDSSFNTALHYAAENGHADVAAFLISKGLDANIKNNQGRTAFFIAVRKDYTDVEEILFSATDCPDFIFLDKKAEEKVEEWKKLSSRKIAYISIERDIGYKITDIFNFQARDRLRIVHNLKTKTESIETKSFCEITDKDSLVTAFKELKKQGGIPDIHCPLGGLEKKPRRGNKLPQKK